MKTHNARIKAERMAARRRLLDVWEGCHGD
jgi:hypothetical protein